MAADASEDRTTFVLGPEAIRWGVEQLREVKAHGFLIAYLEIRRQAIEQDADRVQPEWSRMNGYLEVPGGPIIGKPWFRPFWDQANNNHQEWMRAHPAGSYNTSAIRPGTPGDLVLPVDGKEFVLTEGHAARARAVLLHDEQVPALPLALFLYRNYGFQSPNGVSPLPFELVDIFRKDFRYDAGRFDGEFDELFSVELPERYDWFVPFDSTEPQWQR